MGITDCPKHGRSGFHEACEHVTADLSRECYGDYHYLTLWNMLVCNGCWEKYDLARLERHPDIAGKKNYEVEEESPIFEEYYRAYKGLQYGVRCAKCIAEIRAAADGSDSAAPPNNGMHPTAK